MMWRDLQETSWPNNAMLDHPLLSVLLGQAPDFETLPPLVPDETPIDQHIDLSKCTHVIDADSSQAIVIEEAREGRNLVVQGPPGTGKSQTITNIIATAIHSGRTVLFVAEKTAALDVVHDRLRKAGLDTLCLELHSRKANKREVLTSLDRALRFSGAMQPNANIPTSLASARDKLNCWSSWIHKPIGQTGRTVFDVIGQQVKLGADGVRLIESRLDEAATWSASKLTEAKIAVDRAAETVSRLSVVPKDHPWFGTNISSQSPFDLERLTPIIKTAAEKHVALALEMKEVFAFISDNREPTIADTVTTVKAFRHVAAVPRQGRSVLANQSWVDNLAALEAAIDLGQPFAVLVGEIEDQFKPEAWTCDSGKLLLALRADGPSFLRRFSRRYREANATLRQLLHGIPPKHLKNRIIVMEKLEQAQQAGREFAKAKPLLSSALGGLWGEHKTQWAHARMLAAWARCALAEAGGARLLTFAARTRDLQAFSDFANRLKSAAKAAELAFGEVQKHVQADFQMAFDCENYVRAPTATLATRLEIWEKTRDLINEWVSVRDALLHLRTEGVSAIADHLMNGSIQSKEAGPITELLIAESLWRRAISETPELTSIDGELRSNCVSDFRELDRERIRGARHEVLARYLDQRPNGYARAMGTIRAEIEKKRGHRSIRRLMSVAGSAVQRLKPIFLMSSLSVAQFLPPGQIAFDLLVIDEASQVAPEDALGAFCGQNRS